MNTKYLKHDWIANGRSTTSLHVRWYHWENDLFDNIRIRCTTLSRSWSFFKRWFWNTSDRIHYHGNTYWNIMFGPLRWSWSRKCSSEIWMRSAKCVNILCWWYSDIWNSEVQRGSSHVTTSVHSNEDLNIFFNYECLSCFLNWLNWIIDSSAST